MTASGLIQDSDTCITALKKFFLKFKMKVFFLYFCSGSNLKGKAILHAFEDNSHISQKLLFPKLDTLISFNSFCLYVPHLYFIFYFNFYWSVVDLQCCISFRCTAKWISYTYTYIHSFRFFSHIGHYRVLSIEFPVLCSPPLYSGYYPPGELHIWSTPPESMMLRAYCNNICPRCIQYNGFTSYLILYLILY